MSLPLLRVRNDWHGGMPRLPIGLCYLASFIREKGHNVSLIDLYGLAPDKEINSKGKFEIVGLTLEEGVVLIPNDADVIGVSVHSVADYSLAKDLVKIIKNKYSVPVVLGGVCATVLADDFIESGADYVILSEGEESFNNLLSCIETGKGIENIDGIATKNIKNEKMNFIENLDVLPFPAFDLLPLENYWKLGYAHGPISGKYLTITSSRGCPFQCSFCASPYFWQRKWRARTAENVVDEIYYHHNKYGIKDFHFQDDAFGINKNRAVEIAEEIIKRDIDINWSLPIGVKVEGLDQEALLIMKESGFNYISVSAESASKRVLRLMNKDVDYEYMVRIISFCQKARIKTQTCFTLGYPGEKKEDIMASRRFMHRLIKNGLDEIAVFIITPLPGARLYNEFIPKCDYEELCFSPSWRNDYKRLNAERNKFYLLFFLYKITFSPLKVFKNMVNIFRKKFEIKAEMIIYRVIKSRLQSCYANFANAKFGFKGDGHVSL